MNFSQAAEDYRRIEKAIHFLEENFDRQPELQEVASAACLSEYHFQRLFSRWVGISPKRFLQFLTKEHAKKLLSQSKNLLEATYDSGLTSPGRLHDLFVSCEAVTPGEYKTKGDGVRIRYGIHPTPFGECLLAATDRGICHMNFIMNDNVDFSIGTLRKQWDNADIDQDEEQTASYIRRIFAPSKNEQQLPIHLMLKGTNFQIKVWEALIKVPAGSVVSYQDVAGMIGNPKAVRAVASAVANNPISFVIPCHRVISKSGAIHKYRWGTERKKAILGWEAAH